MRSLRCNDLISKSVNAMNKESVKNQPFTMQGAANYQNYPKEIKLFREGGNSQWQTD